MLASYFKNVILQNLHLVLTVGFLKASELCILFIAKKEHKKHINQKPVEHLRTNFLRKEIKTRVLYKLYYLNPLYNNLDIFCNFLSFFSLFLFLSLHIFFLPGRSILYY